MYNGDPLRLIRRGGLVRVAVGFFPTGRVVRAPRRDERKHVARRVEVHGAVPSVFHVLSIPQSAHDLRALDESRLLRLSRILPPKPALGNVLENVHDKTRLRL